MDYAIERLSCASDHHLVFSVDDSDISSVRLTDRTQYVSSEAADRDESRRLRRCFIHRLRAPDHEIQDAFMIKQARDTPSGHCLGAAQDLPDLVRVQIVIAGLANELPRILAVQDGFCSLEHRGRPRR